ncbi:MAG: tetratricopeptide repeat protein, partial [Planctomycetota bacterium]
QLSKKVANIRSEGITLGNLAIVYKKTGRMELAEQSYDQALQALRKVGDRLIEGIVLCEQASLFIVLERITEARESWRWGIAILKELKELPTIRELSKDMQEACTKANVAPFEVPEISDT